MTEFDLAFTVGFFHFPAVLKVIFVVTSQYETTYFFQIGSSAETESLNNVIRRLISTEGDAA